MALNDMWIKAAHTDQLKATKPDSSSTVYSTSSTAILFWRSLRTLTTPNKEDLEKKGT